MKLCVVGTGYVGLVAGTCFAESGNDVVCVDNVAEKIAALRQGAVPIYEPGLGEPVRRSQVVFVAVGTPAHDDGSADLSAVIAVAGDIARAMDGYRVIVTKSTV